MFSCETIIYLISIVFESPGIAGCGTEKLEGMLAGRLISKGKVYCP